MSILFRDAKYQLVEPIIKDLVEDLQSKNIKVVVLTAYLTGKSGVIESADGFRIEQLQKLGYHFEKSWQNLGEMRNMSDSYDDVKNHNVSKYLFRDGVVFASTGNKGEALNAFFKYANFHPNKIIFIDDKMKYLKSVANMASKECIEFIGIEYTYTNTNQDITPQNAMIFDTQINTLINEERLISFKEAAAIHLDHTSDI